MEREHFATLREYLLHPSSTNWENILRLLENWPKEKALETAISYAVEHLDNGWPDLLRTPPYAWWHQHQQSTQHTLWPLVRHPQPHDEVLAAELCQSLSVDKDTPHLETGICVLKRSSIAFLDGEKKLPPFVLGRDEWDHLQIERMDWRPSGQDGLRLGFPDGSSYEIGFSDVGPREQIHLHWRNLIHSPTNKTPEINTALPHPAYSEEIDKWTLSFTIVHQNPQVTQLNGRPYLSTFKAEELVRYGEWHILANRTWEQLSPRAQQCLGQVSDNIWGPGSWDDEEELEIEAGDYQLFVNRELLEHTLHLALASVPQAETETETNGRFAHTKRVLDMLREHRNYCTQVRINLQWGFC